MHMQIFLNVLKKKKKKQVFGLEPHFFEQNDIFMYYE